MKKILLTGATGFFGRAIIKELAPHYEIIAYGRNEATGKSLEASYPGLRFVKGDPFSISSLVPVRQGRAPRELRLY